MAAIWARPGTAKHRAPDCAGNNIYEYYKPGECSLGWNDWWGFGWFRRNPFGGRQRRTLPDYERTGYDTGRKVLRDDAGPAGYVFEKGLDDTPVGNNSVASWICHSGSLSAAGICAAILAERPLSDRRSAGCHTGWTGNHQSQRLHLDGNRFDPLWHTAHHNRILGR